MTSTSLKFLIACAATVIVSACGGGSTVGSSILPLLAWFDVTPASGVAPLTVQLDASASTGGQAPIVRYTWMFGDGTPMSSGVTTSHVYQTSGTYTVTLWVTNQRDEGTSTTRQVTVSAPPPTLTLTANPPNLAAGEAATLTWSATAATSCTASGGWSGTRASSGTESTAPISATTTYTLVCVGPGGQVTQTVTVTVNAVGGNLLIASISRADSDVNDPSARYQSNDAAATAQLVPNPVVVGGYLNDANRGPTGRSYAAGDLDDIYQVSVAAGQVIELVMPSADPNLPDADRDDADLYLYDANRSLVDGSVGLGQVEQLTVPATGVYYVRVNLYSGAPLYRLSIGQSSVTSTGASLKLSDEFVPGEVIVTLKAASSSATVRQKASLSLEGTYGLQRKAGDDSREMLMAVPANAASVVSMQKPLHAAQTATDFAVPSGMQRKLETLQYVKLLQASRDVLAASLNRIVHASAVPNDPGYSIQRWHYEQIELPAAWSITQGSASVVVAVVDSGVVAAHPDLSSKLVDGYDFVRSVLNQDGDGIDSNPDDPGCALGGGSVFHGTHVSGTVAAATNNGIGVAGVAWNVRLMPVRALDGCTGSGSSYDVAQGIRYAAGLSNDSGRVPSRRADVINLSLGGPGACDSTSASLFAEVRNQGVAVVAAAGNDNTSVPHSPASCPNVISVSAIGPTAQRAPYSNFGASWVDVAAPGGDMQVDTNGDGRPDGIFSTHASGGGASRLATYDFLQGTFMAAPHVAGVIALMKSVKPSLTPAEVDTLLAQGSLTNDIGTPGPDDLGIGLISALKAVQAAGGTAPPLPAALAVTPSSLNFGDVGTLARVTLTNAGSGTLAVTGTATSAAWVRVVPAGVDANGLGAYTVSIERGALTAGSYAGWVDFASSAGTKRVSVLMQVTTVAAEPDAGWQYVLLLDATSGEPLYQTQVSARGERVSYRFGSVKTGDYLMVAGTDMNNDGFICDDGEACGAYPVESQPEVISVVGERLDLDFSSTFRTGVQASAFGASASKPAGFARRE